MHKKIQTYIKRIINYISKDNNLGIIGPSLLITVATFLSYFALGDYEISETFRNRGREVFDFLFSSDIGLLVIVLSVALTTSSLFTYLEKDRFDDLIKRSKKINKEASKLNVSYVDELEGVYKDLLLHEKYLKQTQCVPLKNDVLNEISPSENTFLNSQERIKSEIYRLRRQGILNLVLGICITFLGMILLWIYINELALFASDKAYSDGKYLLSFIPRISLVILVEVFAYFFLRLYKNSIDDIQFFQNELTNIECKKVAIQFCEGKKNLDERKIIIRELMRTDRNREIPAIGKGIDAEGVSNLIKSVADVIKDKD